MAYSSMSDPVYTQFVQGGWIPHVFKFSKWRDH